MVLIPEEERTLTMAGRWYTHFKKDTQKLGVGESKTFPFNWPGVDDDIVAEVQKYFDSLWGKKKFEVSKANFDRKHWLSLKIERIA